MPQTDRATADYSVAAVVGALDLLLAFAAPPHEFGVSELGRRTGMTKNRAYRLLRTLEARGFVRRVGDHFRVGMAALEVGQLAVRDLDVVRAARPVMHELHESTGETIHLAVLDGLEAVCVERVESHHRVRLSADVGLRFPLHAGACPKVLMAHLPEDALEEALGRGLPAFTRRTVADSGVLRQELARIRQDGYGVGDEDMDLGASAVAAPIRDWSGEVVAAISVAGPLSRVRGRLRGELRDKVVVAARTISEHLGYQARRTESVAAL